MKIGLAGWGVETKSAYKYFGPSHEYVICNEHDSGGFPSDTNVNVQYLGLKKVSGDAGSNQDLSYLNNLDDCDQIIYSPVAWNNLVKVYQGKPDILAKMKTTQHIFFEKVDKRKIIGVTGTKGKSTTASLIYSFLEAAGKNVYLGGNIGVCPLDFIDKMSDDDAIAVLELSSYQLNNLQYSPHIAVLLGITPEHLDWHGDFDSYALAKSHLTTAQTPEDILIFNQENEASVQIAANSPAIKSPFPSSESFLRSTGDDTLLTMMFNDGTTIDIAGTNIRGKHNLLNIEAAAQAYSYFCNQPEPVRSALDAFGGLEHRLELVTNIEDVEYVNDSIACTPDATVAAVKSFTGPIVLLLGGHDRGIDLVGLKNDLLELGDKIRVIVCFGEVGKKLYELLNMDHACILTKSDMQDIVNTARDNAQAGDVVLLSPGFSSYDMYNKFSVRGDDFKDKVLGVRKI
jgi:UDP-N-acetylmuramoylalanine--D-glutamate ligase